MALGKGLDSLIPTKKPLLRLFTHKEIAGGGGREDRVWQIPVTEIVPNSQQPRKNFSHQELEDLVASIKKYGVMQPITVTERSDGGYELIAGERRWRGAQIAGLATIPALVRTATDQERLELALIENIQRQDLNPIEEAFAYERLIQEFGLTQQQVAEQVGRSRPAIANTVRLLELPDEIQKALVDGKITAGKARALLSLTDPKEQMNIFSSLIGERVTVRDVERAVALRGPESRKGSIRRDPNLLSQEKLIEERLSTKVHIHIRGERGKIEIEFYSKEELRRLIQELS